MSQAQAQTKQIKDEEIFSGFKDMTIAEQNDKLKEMVRVLREEALREVNPEQEEKEWNQLASLLRVMIRAMRGQPTEDDAFYGLIKVNDSRERARLTQHDVYGHSVMRILASLGGREWKIMEDMAEMEDHYTISEDGIQRKEAILMTRAKSSSDINALEIVMPKTSPEEIEEADQQRATQPQKKGSRLSRLLHRG